MFIASLLLFVVIFKEARFIEHPNIIVVLTDDQDVMLNSMKSLQKTVDLLGKGGVTFKNAFVNSPICCPSRSSILTGMYPHNLGVYNNSIVGNCSSKYWQRNFEKHSIASILKQQKFYRTFYTGKYLNRYGFEDAGGIEHVPVGYDWWVGLKGNSKYFNYTLSLNGTGKFYENSYLTDVLTNYAMDFINFNYKQNFFMIIAPPAAHSPFIPAKRHSNSFPGEETVKTPSFNYSSDDKHWVVKMPPKFLPSNISNLDLIQRKRLQTLLSVDDMMEKLVRNMKELKIYDRTHIIFTSDNGFHIGQFGQPWDKRQPYETDIRVPLIIKGPNVAKNQTIDFPVSSVDIAPTILDLASIPIPVHMDGKSFKKILSLNPQISKDFNEFILIEYWGEGNKKTIDEKCPNRNDELSECTLENWCKCEDSRNNTYVCIVHLASIDQINFKICWFDDDVEFVEAYDLRNDPFELVNINLRENNQYNFYENIMKNLRNCKGISCRNFKYLHDRFRRVRIEKI